MTDRRIETRDRAADAKEHPIEISTRRARGGFRGLPMLYVVIISTALIVIAFLIIWLVIASPRGASHATFLTQPQMGTSQAAVLVQPAHQHSHLG